MPATFRAAATQKTDGGTSIVITKPTGTVDGDVLVAYLAAPTAKTWTPPANWNSTFPDTFGGSAINTEMASWWRVASGEGASWTWSIAGGNDNIVGIVVCYKNADPSDPIDVADTAPDGGVGDPTCPSVTTTFPCLAIYAAATTDALAAQTLTFPAGTTQRATIVNAALTNFVRISAGEDNTAQTAPGATTARVVDNSSAVDGSVAATVTLIQQKPAPPVAVERQAVNRSAVI